MVGFASSARCCWRSRGAVLTATLQVATTSSTRWLAAPTPTTRRAGLAVVDDSSFHEVARRWSSASGPRRRALLLSLQAMRTAAQPLRGQLRSRRAATIPIFPVALLMLMIWLIFVGLTFSAGVSADSRLPGSRAKRSLADSGREGGAFSRSSRRGEARARRRLARRLFLAGTLGPADSPPRRLSCGRSASRESCRSIRARRSSALSAAEPGARAATCGRFPQASCSSTSAPRLRFLACVGQGS